MRQIVEKEFVRMKEGREGEQRLDEAMSKRVNEFEQARFLFTSLSNTYNKKLLFKFPIISNCKLGQVQKRN